MKKKEEKVKLRLRVKELAASRGIVVRLAPFLMRHGFSDKTARKLANNRMVDLKMWQLEKLMHVFKCDANALMFYEAESEGEKELCPYLRPLFHEGENRNLVDEIKNLSQKDVDEIGEFVRKKTEEKKKKDSDEEAEGDSDS